MRCSRGQATVEYVALVGVLALLLTGATAVATGGAPGVVNAVVGQIRHALCTVAGRPCPDRALRPCTVASRRDARHYALSLLVVRVDHDRYVLREAMSDGTFRLTVARSGALGAEVAVGGRARAAAGGREAGVTDEARAAVQGVLGSGRVFVARSEREAAAVMRALSDGDDPAASAREVFYDGGIRGLAAIGVGNAIAGASLRGLSGTMIGGRRDRRTGHVTLSVNAGGAGWGAVTAALGGPVATSERAATLALTLDRQRRPIELSLSASGSLAAGAALPPGAPRALDGRASAISGGGRGRRLELVARLDLRDPLVAAAWNRFRDDPSSADAIRGLGATIRDRAQLDLRSYRTRSTITGGAAGVGQIVQIGGEYDHAIESSRLLAASSRPPGGLWEQRADCVA